MVPFMTRLPSGKCSLVKSSSYMFGRSTMSTYTAVSPWTRSQVAEFRVAKVVALHCGVRDTVEDTGDDDGFVEGVVDLQALAVAPAGDPDVPSSRNQAVPVHAHPAAGSASDEALEDELVDVAPALFLYSQGDR